MKGSRQYRYLRCPHCGRSDGNDDVVTSSNIVEKSNNGGTLIVEEKRRCDICRKQYTVKMHYVLNFEEFNNE